MWVTDKNRSVIARIRPGDMVAIYETGSGKTLRRTHADGSHERVPCRPGRQGLVEIHKVRARARERDDSQPETYWDGSTRWWRWYAATRRYLSAGFVPRTEVAEILGLSPRYTFRGFGEKHSGLKEISQTQCESLMEAFRESQT